VQESRHEIFLLQKRKLEGFFGQRKACHCLGWVHFKLGLRFDALIHNITRDETLMKRKRWTNGGQYKSSIQKTSLCDFHDHSTTCLHPHECCVAPPPSSNASRPSYDPRNSLSGPDGLAILPLTVAFANESGVPILHLSDSCSRRGLNQSVVDEHGQAYVCGLQARDIEDRPDLDSWSSRISEDGTAPGTATHHPRHSASFRLSSLRLNHSTWLILIRTCTVSIIFSTQAGHSSGRPTSTIRFMSES
jgi:hypothetical protein